MVASIIALTALVLAVFTHIKMVKDLRELYHTNNKNLQELHERISRNYKDQKIENGAMRREMNREVKKIKKTKARDAEHHQQMGSNSSILKRTSRRPKKNQ